jgi:hypothetical protein
MGRHEDEAKAVRDLAAQLKETAPDVFGGSSLPRVVVKPAAPAAAAPELPTFKLVNAMFDVEQKRLREVEQAMADAEAAAEAVCEADIQRAIEESRRPLEDF